MATTTTATAVIRGDVHADLVKAALKGVAGTKVDGDSVLHVPTAKVEDAMARLAEAATAAGRPDDKGNNPVGFVHYPRLLTLTWVELAQSSGSTATPGSSATAALVAELNRVARNKWTPNVQSDTSLTWTCESKKIDDLRARVAMELLGIAPEPKPAPAKKATAKKAAPASKQTAAKKANPAKAAAKASKAAKSAKAAAPNVSTRKGRKELSKAAAPAAPAKRQTTQRATKRVAK